MRNKISHDEASKIMFFGKTFAELSGIEKRVIISKLGEPEDYRSKMNYPEINEKRISDS